MELHNKSLVIDIEASSKCNATCFFCPRDSMPFESNMSYETFQKVLDRTDELKTKPLLVFCGTGDSTLNPRLTDFIKLACERGYKPALTTNGILLDKEYSDALLDAGLSQIFFSAAATGKLYSKIYDHDFDEFVEKVDYFQSQAKGRCHLFVAPISNLFSRQHAEASQKFWQDKGINLIYMEYTNRAGLLKLKKTSNNYQILDSGTGNNLCPVAFNFIHIGSDGSFYLCSHDFARRASFGHVISESIADSLKKKLDYFASRQYETTCRHCTHHPINHSSNNDIDDIIRISNSIKESVKNV